MKSTRSLRTILFTDLVGSTERATELGDRRWRAVLGAHDARIRGALRRYLGTELNTAGDGFVATFDDPGRALLCAAEIRGALRPLDLDVRCGLHMGQVEGAGDEVGGIALHLGARVAAEAGAGEILVSRSVRDAVEGGGFRFDDLGTHTLRGAAGEWRLFRLAALPDHAGALMPPRWRRAAHGLRQRRAPLALTGLAVLVVAGYFVAQRGPASAAASEIRSLAVLPLADLSADTGQQYFADGMTEALTSELARIGPLRVISRTSATRFRGTDRPLPEVAAELGVAGIIEGSVLRDGDRVRVTAQLIHARTDTHLWADSYEGDVRDVLRLQQQVARAIAREIRVELGSGGATATARSAAADTERRVQPRAYEAYLRGMYFLSRQTPEDYRLGLRHLREAVEIDPEDPDAWAGLALGYSVIGHGTIPDAYERAKDAAAHAIRLDPTHAGALEAVAEIALYRDWDYDLAERSFRRVLAASPSLAEAHGHYGWLHNLHGRDEQAIASMRRASSLDPLNALWPAWVGWLYLATGQHDSALAWARSALDLGPDHPHALYVAGAAAARLGNTHEAEQMAARLEGIPPFRWAAATLLARLGHHERARRIASDVEREITAMNAYGLAMAHAELGETDTALDWLERAHELRMSWMPWIHRLPALDNLYGEPRFQALARELGLPGAASA